MATLSLWQKRAQEAPLHVDVLVVGAGIVGASAAYWLRRLEPDISVAIIDRGEAAAGATGRNAGFLLTGTAKNFTVAQLDEGRERALWIHRFTRESIAALISETRPASYRLNRCGSLVAAGDEAEEAELREVAQAINRAGHRVTFWSRQEVRKRLMTGAFAGGMFDPEGATADPLLLVRHLIHTSDAAFYPHHQVTAVVREHSGYRVETLRRPVRAGALILALNAYLPRILPSLGAYVRPVRAQMLAARPASELVLPLPVYSHHGFYYVRSDHEGMLLIGGARHLHEREEVGYADATTSTLQADLETYVRTWLPEAGSLRVEARWSGVMGFSPDGLPVVGQLQDGPAFWAAGFTGHGMGFGFGVGKVLARMALGHDAGEAPEHFSPARFG